MNRIELQFYEIIGIARFKKVILLMERIRHRKDHLFNKNYHIQGFSVSAISKFEGYLLYNVVLHCVSIGFILLYIAIAFCFDVHSIVLDGVMTFLFFFNLYCIVLQRYHYLKMRETSCMYDTCRQKRIDRKTESILLNFPKWYNREDMMMDSQLLFRIKDCILFEKNCYIYEDNVPSLLRMRCLLGNTKQIKKEKALERQGDAENEFVKLIEKCARNARPYDKLEKRVEELQQKKNLSVCAIITDSAKTESVLTELFPDNFKERVLEVIAVLEKVFQNRVVENNK